jgi:alkylation response protein AidB-like acyl-CoA dehydrogenase
VDLNPTSEQQQLIDAFGALYAKESTGERVRAAEPLGFDRALWDLLATNGVVEMAVPEAAGGWGASVLDLALVAEQHGRALGSAPLIEAQVAARLLATVGTPAATRRLERALAPGAGVVTLALHGPRDATLEMVPAGAVADEVLFRWGDELLAVAGGPEAVDNLGSLPVADVAVAGAEVLAEGPAVGPAVERALDEWLVLTANALAGLGARALEIGVDYVKERHAFGVPIGSFQAIAHGLADAATALDGGLLLAREAAWAVGEDPARAAELAALAFGFCAESARQASYRSLHYHGGYGFMLEYDIQLYWRRAKAWPAVFGEPGLAYARAARQRGAKEA